MKIIGCKWALAVKVEPDDYCHRCPFTPLSGECARHRKPYHAILCKEEVHDEQEQEELYAGERPVSQAKDEKESEEDIYECEHCNAEFKASEILYRKYGGEIGTIAFCPRCKQTTKLICVSDIVEARKAK